MAEAIVSSAIESLTTILKEKIRDEINLVGGVKDELLYLSSELTTIRNVLDDAERRGHKEKSIQHWLKKLEDISYDMDDVLDEWRHRIEGSEDPVLPRSKVCSFIPCSSLSFKKYASRRNIAVKINGLKERLDVIVKEKDRYGLQRLEVTVKEKDRFALQAVEPQGSERVRSTSSLDASEMHGRVAEKEALVSKLMHDPQDESGPTVISIVGTGGIGKTTLAQLAYNHTQVIKSFELRIWICVSDVFDEVRIAKGIVEAVTKSSPNLNELEELLKCLEDSISGNKFLLVLDDVWTERYAKWEPFKISLKCGGPGSKILVTTRNEAVARMMGTSKIHHLGLLSRTDCWLLMSQIAFFGRSKEKREELRKIGEKIAKKCNGLPLAAKVLGSLLRLKDTVGEWKTILDSEIWQLEVAEVELFPHLFLSYNELSPAVKHCFSYCATFPKDSEIDVEKLIRMWMALGYLSSKGNPGEEELRGRQYFDKLRMHSLFQDFVDSEDRVVCKMHDIVHDFAQYLRKTTIDYNREETDRSPLSQVKIYRTLFLQNEFPPHPLDSVTCLRVLSSEGQPYKVMGSHEGKEEELMRYIEKLIHLRYLELTDNLSYIKQLPRAVCKLYNLQTLSLTHSSLEEIPREIGNLVYLRHLNLSCNKYIEELPETIYNLSELRTLDIADCTVLSKLHEGINKLEKLRKLCNDNTKKLYLIPRGLEQLTGLHTLAQFHAGRDGSTLGSLEKLDQLSGSLKLFIHLYDAKDAMEAQKAKLRNKKDIRRLDIYFVDWLRTSDGWLSKSDGADSIRNETMEALLPPPCMQHLTINSYKGTKFPSWITSSLDHLQSLTIENCTFWSTLPPLAKLQHLEVLCISSMGGLKFLDREFLGIPAGEIETVGSLPSSDVLICFPKLQKLSFMDCPGWEEWEDITNEEATNKNLSIMPCLAELTMNECDSLKALPHRLLCKASALGHLTVKDSFHLWECYKAGLGWWGSPSHFNVSCNLWLAAAYQK